MKTRLILLLTLFVSSSYLWAAQPEQLSCQKINDNTECVYQVYGQDPQNPNQAVKLYLNTNMPYALCASAECSIDKNNPNMANCRCQIYGLDPTDDDWQKISLGPLPYEQAKPVEENGKVVTLTSTYSGANLMDFNSNEATICRTGTTFAWANCFGAKCNVQTDHQALCQCPIVKSNTFVSFGPASLGQCVLPPNMVWSGATVVQNNNNSEIIHQYYMSIMDTNYQMR